MRVYRIEYHQYEYNLTERGGDWHLTPVKAKYVMAGNSIEAVDLLRSDDRGRIEVAAIDYVCRIDIKKQENQNAKENRKSQPRRVRPPDAGVRGWVEATGPPRRPGSARPQGRRPCGPPMVTSISRAASRPAHSERRRNVASNIESIEIFPGENGGHRVVHNFKREDGKKQDAMGGGVYMERPKPAEHFFGKTEDGNVLPHVGKALNLPLSAGNNNLELE